MRQRNLDRFIFLLSATLTIFSNSFVSARKTRSLLEALDSHNVPYDLHKVSFERNEYHLDNFIISNLQTDVSLFHTDFQHIIYKKDGVENRSLFDDHFHCILTGEVFERNTGFKVMTLGSRTKIGKAQLNNCNNEFSVMIHFTESSSEFSGHYTLKKIESDFDFGKNSLSKSKFRNLKSIKKLSSNKKNIFYATLHKDGDLVEHWSCGNEHVEDTFSNLDNFRFLFSQNFDTFEETIENSKAKNSLRKLSFDVEKQSRTKYVKLLIVNDHARFLETGKNTHAYAAQLVQRMQNLYDKLNDKFITEHPTDYYQIKLSIAGMITFQHEDPWKEQIITSYSLTNSYSYFTGYEKEIDSHYLLQLFNNWREQQTYDRRFPEHSLGHLISGNEFSGDTVGLANLFAVCRNQIASAISQSKDFQDETIATIMSHEVAHNLGVYHSDKTFENTLVRKPCSGYIMDSNGIRKTSWSLCTVNYLKMFFEGYPDDCKGSNCVYERRYGASGTSSCLEEKPGAVWSLTSSCGNGLKEPGEQCDCGSDDCSQIDPCCYGKTCTFASSNYECSSIDPCCDERTCKIAAKEKNPEPCRESRSVCDIAEVCDGQSAQCPLDSFLPTGTSCSADSSSNSGSCYAGNCNSHTTQCLAYSSLGFDGACETKGFGSGDSACGDLWCHMAGTASNICYRVQDSQAGNNDNGFLDVLSGTSCGYINTSSSSSNSRRLDPENHEPVLITGLSQETQKTEKSLRNEFMTESEENILFRALETGSGLLKVCDSSSAKCVNPSELAIPAAITCSNGMLDAGETDIDCGGPVCAPCLPGEFCLNHSDCFNELCIDSSYTTDKDSNSSNYGNETNSSEYEYEFIEYPEGCTTLLNESSCDLWSGCIWLEEFTRCKKTGLKPDTGECYTQKQRQSCVNYQLCQWDYDLDKCIDKKQPDIVYGKCYGTFELNNNKEKSWFDKLLDKISLFFESNETMGYILLGCFSLSLILCFYSCLSCCIDKCCPRKKKKHSKHKHRKHGKSNNKNKNDVSLNGSSRMSHKHSSQITTSSYTTNSSKYSNSTHTTNNSNFRRNSSGPVYATVLNESSAKNNINYLGHSNNNNNNKNVQESNKGVNYIRQYTKVSETSQNTAGTVENDIKNNNDLNNKLKNKVINISYRSKNAGLALPQNKTFQTNFINAKSNNNIENAELRSGLGIGEIDKNESLYSRLNAEYTKLNRVASFQNSSSFNNNVETNNTNNVNKINENNSWNSHIVNISEMINKPNTETVFKKVELAQKEEVETIKRSPTRFVFPRSSLFNNSATATTTTTTAETKNNNNNNNNLSSSFSFSKKVEESDDNFLSLSSVNSQSFSDFNLSSEEQLLNSSLENISDNSKNNNKVSPKSSSFSFAKNKSFASLNKNLKLSFSINNNISSNNISNNSSSSNKGGERVVTHM